ncbi:ABC transporter permease [Lentibacillus cibarius]|uniref:ABC transporter permease n=1 Tax=Lentibacillus cibarius TaxID=2583219 RepID=A0A549YFC1_9BACI|nr:ABC transporter permease [Lentibacillus cibarius]TRM10589.1 ABC transporter permease [Lentibacillus cibarius]
MNRKRLVAEIVRWFFIMLVAVFLIWSFQNGYLDLLYNEADEFFVLLRQHAALVALSSFLAVLIAIPVGILVTRPRFRRVQWLFMGLANIGQTVPNLAMLALAMGFLGTGFKPAVFALFLYSILPILRNTVAGIDSINSDLIDAAEGMGFKQHQILWRIELPNAAYSILAGVRTSLVINVGTAALAFLIGGGGLGTWVYTGISLFDNAYLISGALPITLFALAMDFLLRGIERILIPKPLRVTASEAA